MKKIGYIIFLITLILLINVHGYIQIDNFENIGEHIGNYFCVYFHNLGLCICNERDFKVDVSKSDVIQFIPFEIKYTNDEVYSEYIKIVSSNFKKNNIDSNYIHSQQSDAIWFMSNEKNILFWDSMKPIVQKIFDDMFTKSGINIPGKYPIVHFRCADVPFGKHPQYHLVKYEFYKKALEMVKNKTGIDYKKIILLSCNTHLSGNDNQVKCGEYIQSMVDYFNSIGYEVEVQCNSNIDDFAKLYYAPAVISNVSSFSFMTGYFGKGVFVCSQHNDERNTSDEMCNICDDWMIKGYQIKHKLVDDYYDTEKIINNFLL
jgi:hypothetical protein